MKFGLALWRAAALAAMALVASCTTPAAPAGEVDRIVSTTSFGMCVGYCTTRLEIHPGEAVLVRQARGGRGAPQGLPDQRFETALGAEEWRELQSLAARSDLSALPDVIGCPDCADGGAETLAIGAGRTITFEYNSAIPEAQTLLDRLRALRARLTPD